MDREVGGGGRGLSVESQTREVGGGGERDKGREVWREYW